jgi:hypothetical protein
VGAGAGALCQICLSTHISPIVYSSSPSLRVSLHLVLTQPAISSQTIDNLNASIHPRTHQTGVFLSDETLGPRSAAAPHDSLWSCQRRFSSVGPMIAGRRTWPAA